MSLSTTASFWRGAFANYARQILDFIMGNVVLWEILRFKNFSALKNVEKWKWS